MELFLQAYLKRFSDIAGSMINCGSVLNWFEVISIVFSSNCTINISAVVIANGIFWWCMYCPILTINEILSTIHLWCERDGGEKTYRYSITKYNQYSNIHRQWFYETSWRILWNLSRLIIVETVYWLWMIQGSIPQPSLQPMQSKDTHPRPSTKSR